MSNEEGKSLENGLNKSSLSLNKNAREFKPPGK